MTLIKIATNKIYSTEWPGEEKFAWQMLSKNWIRWAQMRLFRLNKNKTVNRCDDIRYDSNSRPRGSHFFYSAADIVSNNPETPWKSQNCCNSYWIISFCQVQVQVPRQVKVRSEVCSRSGPAGPRTKDLGFTLNLVCHHHPPANFSCTINYFKPLLYDF